MEVFRGKLESACLSIHVSVCQCVNASVYKILVSVKALAGVLTLYRIIRTFNDPKKEAF